MALTLRETTHPQFTNKNDELTNAELDTNFIDLMELMNEARGLVVFETYDSGTVYQKDSFVVYNYNIYRYINDNPASNKTPSSEPTYWIRSSFAEYITLYGGVTVVTLAELATKITNSELVTGSQYFVSDTTLFTAKGYKYLLKAVSTNKIALSGHLLAYVPDFQVTGVYTGVASFGSQLGVWRDSRGTLGYDNLVGTFSVGETITGVTSGATATIIADTGTVLTLENIVGEFQNNEQIGNGLSPETTADVNGTATYTFNPQLGDVVIRNAKHYRKKTNTVTSTAPESDGTNYESLAFALTNGYIVEVDNINYDADNDKILKRTDKRWNEVELNTAEDSIDVFQWGNDNVYYNKVLGLSRFDCFNNFGTIIFNHLNAYSEIVASNNESQLQGNMLHAQGFITCLGNKGQVNANVLNIRAQINADDNGENGSIEYNIISNDSDITTAANDGLIQDNHILNGSRLVCDSNTGDIELNTIDNDSTVTGTLNLGWLTRNTFRDTLMTAVVADAEETSGNYVRGFRQDGGFVPSNTQGKIATPENSNMEATINITSLPSNILNLDSPTTYNNFGIINLETTNASETIAKIKSTNQLYTLPLEFRCRQAGKTLTFNHTAAASATYSPSGGADMVLSGSNFVLTGRANYSDALKIRRDAINKAYMLERGVNLS